MSRDVQSLKLSILHFPCPPQRRPSSKVPCQEVRLSSHFPFTVYLTSTPSPPHLVSAGSPSRGGDVAVYVFDINQPSLPTPFYSCLVSLSVLIALSTVFHYMTSPDNSPLSHSVLPVLYLPHRPFQRYISNGSILQPSWLTGLRAPTN